MGDSRGVNTALSMSDKLWLVVEFLGISPRSIDKQKSRLQNQLLILPKLQLGVSGQHGIEINRFNGLDRSTRVFRKPLKRFLDFMRA